MTGSRRSLSNHVLGPDGAQIEDLPTEDLLNPNVCIQTIFVLSYACSLNSNIIYSKDSGRRQPMLTLRKAAERGHADHGWLDSYHTFSFANYYDPAHMGFRALRVINEDWVAAKNGFPTHSHRDMEIITYVLAGALEHRDSMGNSAVIRPGEVQRMTAGTGVTHSEYNPSGTDPVHLLQIWILPNAPDLVPSYEQKAYGVAEKQGKLRLIAAMDSREGAVTVHQDLNLYATVLAPGEQVTYAAQADRYLWVQVARGAVLVNGKLLEQGDAVALAAEETLEMIGQAPAEVLVFDLA
jgi:quercetin 2,3-dioxygenase